jgi:hypothetical protein
MLIPRLARFAVSACLALAAAGTVAAEPTGLERTYLERAAITAADRSCNLFTDGERIALQAGLTQARGALLRAAYDPREVDRLGREVAQHARSIGCTHPEIVSVSALVRDAYRQFAKTSYLAYPGRFAAWEASRSRHDQWAVKQTERASGAILGTRRGEKPGDVRLAFALSGDRPAPASAQLLMRDPTRLSEPWVGVLGETRKSLAPPPASMSRHEWAASYRSETDNLGDAIHVFYFSDAVLKRLEALDPREAISVELAPAARDRAAKPVLIAFEVGDFLAAQYFTRIPAPEYPTQTAAR